MCSNVPELQVKVLNSRYSFAMQIYAEKLIRLPTFFLSLAKQDILDIPVGDSPPIMSRGHVTFGRCPHLHVIPHVSVSF